MDSASTAGAAPEAVRFRPGKKRKAYRQRPEDLAPEAPSPAPNSDDNAEASDNEATVAAAIRLRNARKARLRGVGFSTAARLDDVAPASQALVVHDERGEPEAVGGITNRFTHQTGLLHEVDDKHMYVCPHAQPPECH